MQNIRFALALSVTIAGTLEGANVAGATPFNSTVAGFVLSNTLVDSDLYFLSKFVGVDSSSTLNYAASINSTGFAESMSGPYLGQLLDIAYSAAVVSVTPTEINMSWTGIGHYGVESWDSSGSAMFTFPTATTFQVNLVDVAHLGASSGLETSVIDGALISPIIYTGGSGTFLPVNLLCPTSFHTLEFRFPGGFRNDFHAPGCLPTPFIISKIDFLDPSPPPSLDPDIFGLAAYQDVVAIEEHGTIGIVAPEPATIALFGAGLTGLGAMRRRRRKAKS